MHFHIRLKAEFSLLHLKIIFSKFIPIQYGVLLCFTGRDSFKMVCFKKERKKTNNKKQTQKQTKKPQTLHSQGLFIY